MTSIARLRSGSPTIRSRVLALILIVLVPTLAAFTWLAISYAGAQRHLIEVERKDLAGRIVALLDRDIAEVKGTLATLSTSPDLAGGSLDEFRRHASLAATQPGYESIDLYDGSGKKLLSTVGGDEPLPTIQGRPELIAVALERLVAVSDVSRGTGGAKSTFAVAVAVPKPGSVRLVLVATLFADQFDQIFTEAGLSPDWTAAIVDWNGRFAARSRTSEKYIGESARPELALAAQGQSPAGEFENVTYEGVVSLNSFRRSALAGWTVVVAVPRDLLAAPLWRTMTLVILGGAVASLLSLVLASLMAAGIANPVRNLSKAATALVEGRPIPDLPSRISELDEVHSAFELASVRSAHFAAIVASSGDAILSVGIDRRVRSWNAGAEKLFGYSEAEIIGQPLAKLIPESRRAESEEHFARIVAGETLRVETTRLRKGGTEVEVSLNLAPIRSPSGAIIGKSTIAHDITERKAAEAYQRFLIRELTHRSKNLLAIVQSMASQTARSAGTLERFRERFTNRLHGLAASHDLLVKQNWEGAPLDELIRSQIELFMEGCKRLVAEGPPVIVDTKAAQVIGLALHELATNSLKYGALSTAAGWLTVTWSYKGQMNGRRRSIEITWIERGGPPVSPPDKNGFGRFVIDRMIRQSIDGDVKIEFAPEGLQWTLIVPSEHIVSETGGRGERELMPPVS